MPTNRSTPARPEENSVLINLKALHAEEVARVEAEAAERARREREAAERRRQAIEARKAEERAEAARREEEDRRAQREVEERARQDARRAEEAAAREADRAERERRREAERAASESERLLRLVELEARRAEVRAADLGRRRFAVAATGLVLSGALALAAWTRDRQHDFDGLRAQIAALRAERAESAEAGAVSQPPVEDLAASEGPATPPPVLPARPHDATRPTRPHAVRDPGRGAPSSPLCPGPLCGTNRAPQPTRTRP